VTAGGLRIGVIGASGCLGSELLELLAQSSLDVGEIRAVATQRSLGREFEFRGVGVPIETEAPPLRGLDLLFLCAPADVSMEFARQALRAEVPCIDVGGALAASRELQLQVAAFGPPAAPQATPLLVAPPAPALALALVLRPLAEAAGLRRVSGTCLDGASWSGRAGIEALYRESLALFNQAEPPELEAFPQPVAFDCLPRLGSLDAAGGSDPQHRQLAALGRLLGEGVGFALTGVQVPVFVGFGAALAAETQRALSPEQAEALLGKAPGLDLSEPAPSLRAAAGSDAVRVGRVRCDASVEHGLLLWVAADLPHLAAANAVRLAVARVGRHH